MTIAKLTTIFIASMMISPLLAAPKNQSGRCQKCGKMVLQGASHVCLVRKNTTNPPVPRNTTKLPNSSKKMDVDAPIPTTKHELRTREAIAKGTSGGPDVGSAETEACVEKILWWLKNNQRDDGSFQGGNRIANTSLALLTFLAHNEFPGSTSPHEEDFAPAVRKAMDYLINAVDTNRPRPTISGSDGNEYSFLMATYALCEAYGITHDLSCKEAVLPCVKRIIDGQSETGGWDYKINPNSTRDDTSFGGWALQALKAAQMAGIRPKGIDACVKKAMNCLKTRNFNDGGFNYTAGGRPTGLTAAGCLCMQIHGEESSAQVTAALNYMREWRPSFDVSEISEKHLGSSPQYYCYYATQCKYYAGARPYSSPSDTKAWRKWNATMKSLYPRSITRAQPVVDAKGETHEAGYFTNKDAHTSRPVMDSCLVALQLMVYYRYIPSWRSSKQYYDVEQRKDYPELVAADAAAKKTMEELKAREESVTKNNNEIKAKYADLQTTLYAAIIAREEANPERHCEIHKWKEEFAPKFKGDLYTEQQKTAYAQNYMKALELMRDGLLKCTCNSIYWRQKYDTANRLYEETDAKMEALRKSHPEIKFSSGL